MSDLDLPVLDFRDLATDASPSHRRRALTSLEDALRTWGFVAITHHGVEVPLLDEAYTTAAALFQLPEAAKRACERPEIGRQRGYTGFGVERAKNESVADLKEFWQVGRVHGASPALPDNLWPAELPAAQEVFLRLFHAMDGFATTLLGAVAECVGLDAPTLQQATVGGNSVMRLIHYPPLGPTARPGAVRAAAHEDINLITVLPASTQPGLELLDRQGVWRPVVTPPNVMVCDTGDLLQHYTAGRLPAVTHRVVNPPGSANVSRYSMPFFVHPRPDWLIEPIGGDRPTVRAGDYLRQRLIENGVLDPEQD